MEVGRAVVSGVIASKQGLDCSGYETLNNRTKHLRERLYVTVRDGGKLFLPRGHSEHFPVGEIRDYLGGRLKLRVLESVGAGGGEVVFTCEGPAADEGAEVIAGTLPRLEEVLGRTLLARKYLAGVEDFHYGTYLRANPAPAYRPETPPERAGTPDPFTPKEREILGEIETPAVVLERKKREYLKSWGLLGAYEATQRGPGPPPAQSFNSSPWKETPWM